MGDETTNQSTVLTNDLIAQLEEARKVGIREVVEWIEANALDTHSTAFSMSIVVWQAKLKEWGL